MWKAHGRGVAAKATLLACLLSARSSHAFALDPSLDISQYAHQSWKIRAGFTKGVINDIAQTPDGYLWLGTEFGSGTMEKGWTRNLSQRAVAPGTSTWPECASAGNVPEANSRY